jgi:hypothetical protein
VSYNQATRRFTRNDSVDIFTQGVPLKMGEHTKFIQKFKFSAFLLIAILLVINAVVFLGEPFSSMSFSGGGKSGFYILILATLSSLFHPLFGEYALFGVFIILAIVFGSLSFLAFKKLNAKTG